jgi:GTP-binding protein
MEIKSAVFVKGVTSALGIFEDGLPHVAFIGRSNVGKSSTINALTKIKSLAKTSSTPGHTKQINFFLINNKFYIVDLPGYGFARGSHSGRGALHDLIRDYLFNQDEVNQKVVLIIDAKVGPTSDDLETLQALEEYGKNIIVAVNKIDKLKNSEAKAKLLKIHSLVGGHKVLAYSAEKKTGVQALLAEIVS